MMKIIILFLLLSAVSFAEVTGDTVPLTTLEDNTDTLIAETVEYIGETPPFPPTAQSKLIAGNDATILGFVSLVALVIILYIMWKMIRKRGKRGKPRSLKATRTVKVIAV